MTSKNEFVIVAGPVEALPAVVEVGVFDLRGGVFVEDAVLRSFAVAVAGDVVDHRAGDAGSDVDAAIATPGARVTSSSSTVVLFASTRISPVTARSLTVVPAAVTETSPDREVSVVPAGTPVLVASG